MPFQYIKNTSNHCNFHYLLYYLVTHHFSHCNNIEINSIEFKACGIHGSVNTKVFCITVESRVYVKVHYKYSTVPLSKLYALHLILSACDPSP